MDLIVLQLAKKTVTLLALVNADRCSDLAALDHENVQWTSSGVEITFKLDGLVHLEGILLEVC